MTLGLAKLLRLASIAICLISIAWFAAFATTQSSQASDHQQAEVKAAEGVDQPVSKSERPSTLHRDLNKVFSSIASPFSSVTSGWKSQWTIHIVQVLLALLIYGFGVGFIARLLRMAS